MHALLSDVSNSQREYNSIPSNEAHKFSEILKREKNFFSQFYYIFKYTIVE